MNILAATAGQASNLGHYLGPCDTTEWCAVKLIEWQQGGARVPGAAIAAAGWRVYGCKGRVARFGDY